MIVHALTPVTRPWNLSAVGDALRESERRTRNVTVRWHRVSDPYKTSPGGFRLRNRMLSGIHDGWLWMVDDDTLPHTDVLRRVEEVADGSQAVVFAYDGAAWPGCSDPDRLWNGGRGPAPEGMCPFDTCQVIWRRELMGDYRFRENRAGDGWLWEEVIKPCTDVTYLDDVLATYNSLRPGQVG